MKTYYSFTLLLLVMCSSFGQKRISFEYDKAGNQTKRFICVNCSARPSNDTIPQVKTLQTLTESDMIIDNQDKQISYYPNPVVEELYVKWTMAKGNVVTAIEVYSMSGQLMNKTNNLQRTDIATVWFKSYPQGFYNVILLFDNGDKKTLKIVKQ